MYGHLLKDLNDIKLGSSQMYKKPFSEITPLESETLAGGVAKETSWSSDYDAVSRSPFAKDVTHLQSLLEALLQSKNFDRAKNILLAIHPLLSNPENFLYAFNKYLEAWALEEDVKLGTVESYIQQIEARFGDRFRNHRTEAILLNKALNIGADFSIPSSPTEARKVLNHIDILGVDNLIKIFQSGAVTREQVPTDLLEIYDHATDAQLKEPEYFRDGSAVPVISKDADKLLAVDSFGLRLIRHTLLGLEGHTNTPALQAFLENLEDEQSKHLVHDTLANKKDYFQIYKHLQTEEQRQAFNAALDEFNEGRQRSLEALGVDAAKEKWKHAYEEMHKRGAVNVDKNLNSYLFKWYSDLLPYVEEEWKVCQKMLAGEIDMATVPKDEVTQMKERAHYAPYLTLVPPNKMCVIAILELIKLNSSGGIADGMRIARAMYAVGKAIELEYRSQDLINTEGRSISKKNRSIHQWRKLIRKRDYRNNDPTTVGEWDSLVCVKVGSVLVALVLHSAKVSVRGTDPTSGKTVFGLQPAFHHTYQFLNGQKVGVLRVHKLLINLLGGTGVSNSVQPQLLPMLVPPRPWSSYNSGGYLYSQNNIVRTKDSAETLAYLRALAERGDLARVYDGLNVLGNTAWTINRRVFDVISHYWNKGTEFIDIPPVANSIAQPEPVAFDADPAEKLRYMKALKRARLEVSAVKSQRCDINYKLEIARAFLGEKMYFPHNVDFRGRAYPLLPHLNHLGNDLTRSLFLFWEGKKLGKEGLRWLKIHLANVYGIDKAPLHEREQFVNDNLQKILDTAADPIGENKWWTKGEKPWQVLTVCFELADAYKLEDPTEYVSHMPVHQDGTCNGLQHYAALGGDVEGARQVNLVPANRPQDVYAFVAGLVQRRLDEDAANDDKLAQFLQGKITRKVVKQTVMTNVYGVTYIGALHQIEKQIAHHFDQENESDRHWAAAYLAKLVLASVRELFEGAHLIQDWLGECAKRISKSVRIDYEDRLAQNSNKPNHLSSVIWTTPLGLPCVQPYRVSKKQLIHTNLQDISITDPFGASQVDARKQQVAFTPNFVHSLDATHMLMTARACGQDGLAFASVHDSYWTHAVDVDKMNLHIRDQFVRLHEANLIHRLRDEFKHRYRGFLQVIKISSDHEVAKKIRDARRQIARDLGRGLTVADEIYLEKKRQQLLDSNDPKLVEMGQKMVTTVSVTEGYDMYALSTSNNTRVFQALAHLEFPEVPERGEFDVTAVKDSPYFFS